MTSEWGGEAKNPNILRTSFKYGTLARHSVVEIRIGLLQFVVESSFRSFDISQYDSLLFCVKRRITILNKFANRLLELLVRNCVIGQAECVCEFANIFVNCA